MQTCSACYLTLGGDDRIPPQVFAFWGRHRLKVVATEIERFGDDEYNTVVFLRYPSCGYQGAPSERMSAQMSHLGKSIEVKVDWVFPGKELDDEAYRDCFVVRFEHSDAGDNRVPATLVLDIQPDNQDREQERVAIAWRAAKQANTNNS